MPRLFDLLQFLASPGLEDTWLLLDIKVGIYTVVEKSPSNEHLVGQ